MSEQEKDLFNQRSWCREHDQHMMDCFSLHYPTAFRPAVKVAESAEEVVAGHGAGCFCGQCNVGMTVKIMNGYVPHTNGKK